MSKITLKPVPAGVVIAKNILAGDVDNARKSSLLSYSVAESRAITGACRVANERFGINLTLSDFIRNDTNPAELNQLAPVDPVVADLREFLENWYGGEQNFQHWLKRIVYTEGVKYVADKAGAYWLIDVIASHQPCVLRKIAATGDRDFQVWKLTVTQGVGKVTCDNGHGGEDRIIYKKQTIPFTDFPLDEIKLYVEDGVLMLPSER